MERIAKIKELAVDGFGTFLDSFQVLHGEVCVGIQTPDPDTCSREARARGVGNVNIYLAGIRSVVCWPGVTKEG